MTKLIAINDLKLKCGNLSFKECSVVFRNKVTLPEVLPSKLLISILIKPSCINHKGTFICYCDGIIINDKEPEEEQDEYYEDPDVEDPFSDYNLVEKMDLMEDIEVIYQKEKVSWVHRFSKNDNLIQAINLEYGCDDCYCQERIENEYPGFFVVDHTTFFYKAKFPSKQALELERRFSLQVNTLKCKYGTYIRIVELEKHDNVPYGDQEAIVMFNYLHKFDVIGLVSVVEKIYGRQFESSSNGSKILSD